MPYTISNVNVGTYPNDGQGEPLRDAFLKINNNFANVYAMAANASGGGMQHNRVARLRQIVKGYFFLDIRECS